MMAFIVTGCDDATLRPLIPTLLLNALFFRLWTGIFLGRQALENFVT
ncbi:hypothetical protein XaFJ1_GM002371 [Xanthomonas albilineans]|nr:hypothetical protein XaFJ1_GM002371 [Xanthomonas albilineans]